VEISGYQGLHSIAATVRRFGPERLLFGTHMPLFTPGAAIAAVTYADISETERALIAADNLHRLLEATHGR
jgi:predicted TIM-barrel fold metal-dependent hydrolase